MLRHGSDRRQDAKLQPKSPTTVRNQPSWHPEVEDLIRQSQDALARFLGVEINTGIVFVELAKARDTRREPERRRALKNQAELAVRSVRRFNDRLDFDLREHIEGQLVGLERAISSL